MLDRVIGFFLKMVPEHDPLAIDPKDPQAQIRPNAAHDDLGRRINGGWNENILGFCAAARKPNNAWTVDHNGDLVYDKLLRGMIIGEFAKRAVTVTERQVDVIMWNASGHSDYTSKLARGCYELEVRLKEEQ